MATAYDYPNRRVHRDYLSGKSPVDRWRYACDFIVRTCGKFRIVDDVRALFPFWWFCQDDTHQVNPPPFINYSSTPRLATPGAQPRGENKTYIVSDSTLNKQSKSNFIKEMAQGHFYGMYHSLQSGAVGRDLTRMMLDRSQMDEAKGETPFAQTLVFWNPNEFVTTKSSRYITCYRHEVIGNLEELMKLCSTNAHFGNITFVIGGDAEKWGLSGE